MLLCENLSLRFDGLVALDALALAVDKGEIVGLIGPNGAGKSTFFNLLTGIYQPSRGRIVFCGRDLRGVPSHEIAARGIARTFQNIRLVKDLSVLDNIVLGMHSRTSTGVLDALFRPRRAQAELKASVERAMELIDIFNPHLRTRCYDPAGALPQADRRRLEILRALAAEPRLLLLDEPSAGMDEVETAALNDDIRRVHEIRGEMAIIIVEHDMFVISELTQRTVVLDHGMKIAEGTFDAVREVREVQEAYLGKRAAH